MLAHFTSAKTQSGLHCLAAVPCGVVGVWAALTSSNWLAVGFWSLRALSEPFSRLPG